MMMVPEKATMVRMYCKASEKSAGGPAYRAAVEAARRLKLAGASVFPVEAGYGSHRKLHDLASEYSSFDIPIVVEFVDSAERIQLLTAELESIVSEGLVVLSPVEVFRGSDASAPADGDRMASPEGRISEMSRRSAAEDSSDMKIDGDAKRMTVYIGSADTVNGRNLAVAIVEHCRAMGMAGATICRGVMGFGKRSVIHKAHLLGLSDDLPERVEIIDRAEEIERLLPVLDGMVKGGLIVVEDVHVIRYLHDPAGGVGRP
jgi:PII-like signaling protein